MDGRDVSSVPEDEGQKKNRNKKKKENKNAKVVYAPASRRTGSQLVTGVSIGW